MYVDSQFLFVCLLCFLYHVINIPKLKHAKKKCVKDVECCNLMLEQLQTGDIVMVRKRRQPMVIDALLYSYFNGHSIMCLRIKDVVLGVDLIDAHNDIPLNKKSVFHPFKKNANVRVFPLCEYIRDTRAVYNSEITFFTHIEAPHKQTSRHHQLLCALHYLRHVNVNYLSYSSHVFQLINSRLCTPCSIKPLNMNCVQFVLFIYCFLHNKTLPNIAYGTQLDAYLHSSLKKTVL